MKPDVALAVSKDSTDLEIFGALEKANSFLKESNSLEDAIKVKNFASVAAALSRDAQQAQKLVASKEYELSGTVVYYLLKKTSQKEGLS